MYIYVTDTSVKTKFLWAERDYFNSYLHVLMYKNTRQ